MSLRKCTMLGLLVWAWTTLHVSAEEIEGPLGSWLDDTAMPQLTDLLERHPRFKGEALKVMAMRDGRPREVGDQLTNELRQVVTHRLLSGTSMRIPLPGGDCQLTRINVVLGIEVGDKGQGRYGVTLALLDTSEGVWINGTIVKWSGRLQRAQRAALNLPLPTSRGYQFSQPDDIAEALVTQWLCQQPVMTPIFVEVDDDVDSELSHAFRKRVANRMFVTQNRLHAQSLARLSLTSNGKARVTVILANDTEAVLVSQIGVRQGQTSEATQSVLLSGITRNENRARCRGTHCVDVSVELLASAWVLPFSTSDGKVTPMKCGMPAKREPGLIRYGLRVPESASWYRPSLGFYVLAVDDESTARKLQRRLGRSTRECSSMAQPADEWITALQNITQETGADVSWRSMHFHRDANSISTM
jgi:hypothetical protein